MNESANPPAQSIPVYIILGSNIDPQSNLPLAVQLLRETHPVLKISSVWETPPVGTIGASFLNAAVLIQTHLEIEQLKLGVLREIEARLGRIRTADKNAPRTMDMDIIIYDNQVVDEELWILPHLAVPLAEIAGDLKLPGSVVTLQSIANRFLASGGLITRAGIDLLHHD